FPRGLGFGSMLGPRNLTPARALLDPDRAARGEIRQYLDIPPGPSNAQLARHFAIRQAEVKTPARLRQEGRAGMHLAYARPLVRHQLRPRANRIPIPAHAAQLHYQRS